ncbi:MAG: hypothetical protein WD845_11000 [Pirellulales bacterium]
MKTKKREVLVGVRARQAIVVVVLFARDAMVVWPVAVGVRMLQNGHAAQQDGCRERDSE